MTPLCLKLTKCLKSILVNSLHRSLWYCVKSMELLPNWLRYVLVESGKFLQQSHDFELCGDALDI
jgi:hypothetical protein